MTNTSKHTYPVREVSVSVLEGRLKRAVRPKDRLWAAVRFAERLLEDNALQTEQALVLLIEAKQLAENIGDRRGMAATIRSIGSCKLNLFHFTAALEMFELALSIAEQTGDAEMEIKILLNIGGVYIKQSRHDLALETLQKCAELAELVGNTQLQAFALHQIGDVFTDYGRYDESLECHMKSLTLLNRTGLIYDRAITLMYMGNTLRLMGRYAEALSSTVEARQLCRIGRHDRIEGGCQNNIGLIYTEIGDYPNALSSFLTSAKILERVGNRLDLALVHGNLMGLYLKLGNPEQARYFGEKTLTIYEEIGNKHGQASIFILLGESCLNRGEKVRAKRFLKQSISLSGEIGAKEFEAKAITMLANLEIDRGEFAGAEKLLQNALAIASEINNRECIVATFLGFGTLFNKQAQLDRALPFLEHAITIAQETRSRPQEQEAERMLAETLEAKGDLKRALMHWKLASSVQEAMLGIEKQKAITAIQIHAAIETSEKEKALLRKGTKLKSREVERMAMDLTEKTELIRSTSRRVKEIVKLVGRNGRSPHSQLLEGLLSDLNHSLGDKRVIPNEFQLVHRNTLQKLSKNYPTLSLTERKVCVLLHDGLSSKQMADMLKISTRTVDWHRTQIRKKMKLEREASLSTTLAKI